MNKLNNQSPQPLVSPQQLSQKLLPVSIDLISILFNKIKEYQSVSQEQDYRLIKSTLKDSMKLDPLGRDEIIESLHHKFNRSKGTLKRTLGELLSPEKEGEELSLNLVQDFHLFYQALQEHDLSGYQFISQIYEWFIYNSRGYFYCTNNTPYLYFQGKVYEVGTNKVFKSFLAQLSFSTSKACKAMAEELGSRVLTKAQHIPQLSPLHTCFMTNNIYLNISPHKILQMSQEGGLRLLNNAFNPYSLLLTESPSFTPISINDGVEIKNGMEKLKKLIFDNLSCSLTEKYFILCWFIMLPLQELVESKPLLKFTGNQSSGKSTALKLLNCLWTGESTPNLSTAFSSYHHASNNLLTCLDNLESKNINEDLLQFLILAATGVSRKKMVGATKVIENKVKSMVLVTSIEPFTRSELVSRLWEVHFKEEYKNPQFVDSRVLRELKVSRELILTSLFKFISLEVLPHLFKREKWLDYLSSTHKGHYKNRLDDFASISLLILNKLLVYIPTAGQEAKSLCSDWIKTQNSYCNDQRDRFFLDCFDTLIEEYKKASLNKELGEFMKKYQSIEMKMDGDSYVIDVTVKQIANLVAINSSINNSYNTYKSNNHLLMSRLRNDYSFMEKNGWQIIDSYKVSNGYPVSQFIRKSDRGDGGD